MSRLVDDTSPWSTKKPADHIDEITLSDINNPFNRFTTVLLGSHNVILKWLQKVWLLAATVRCERSDMHCWMCQRDKTTDGYVWRCPARHEISIRRNSFFSKSHLHIPDIINFVITYAEGQSLWKCAQSAGVGYRSTAVDWGSFCRDLFVEYHVRNIKDEILQGEIEVDESLFGRRTKCHRGDSRGMKIWIVGLVERSINRLKLFPVDRRDAETLLPLIQSHVEKGSTVMTDGWAAYSDLTALGYTHYVIHRA